MAVDTARASEWSLTMGVVAPYSRSRIDRAGVALRAHQTGGERLGIDELVAELEVVEAFRSRHGVPMTRLAANRRYFVGEASAGAGFVGQRLKRLDTIRDKLERHPTMALSRMHDIGGCRAVLPDQVAVDAVIGRLRVQRRWDLLERTWDYVEHPKPDGCRVKHLVARKDGVLIEIQLRTVVQHEWAELVERIDRRYATGLKTGRAEARVRDVLAARAQTLAEAEMTGADAAGTMESLRSLFDAAEDSSQ